jgi:AcrB/AcrD/AcrF family
LLKARAERDINVWLRVFLYLNTFEPPGVTGHDLGTRDLLNHQAVSCHQLQCRLELGDPAYRDQVAPSRAILPQSGIQDGARRTDSGLPAAPVNDLPAVDYPVIQVSVTYPGGSPETMANTCATPLEKQFLQIPGLDLVTTNQTGQSTLVLQFSLDKSLGDAATDVQAAISRAQGF